MVRRDCAVVLVTLTCLLLVSSAAAQLLNLAEGAICRTQNRQSGRCELITRCPSQGNTIGRGPRPVTCSFKGDVPIVCCAEPKKKPDKKDPGKEVTVSGRKAEDACRSFEVELNNTFVPYIIAGEDTYRGEFPHMAAVGYRNDDGNGYAWDCGGSLISNQFVLTAAHCIHNTVRGKPDVVWAGVHNLSNSDEGRILRVIQDFVHPNYIAPSHYYDVALLKVPNVKFDENIFAACLYTKMDVPKAIIVTGWGIYDDDLVRKSDVLLKANLVPVAMNDCNSSFYGKSAFTTRLSRGIAPEMICARGANGRSDTCGGDSGGPMQSRENSTLYNIVGVTSFGALCGGIGVYDRVASFIDWIENIVWAD